MTFWFGASLNKNNLLVHDTGNIVVHGSDGSQSGFICSTTSIQVRRER